jgi:hypothetical protein
MNEVMGTLRLAVRPAALLFVSHARKENPEFDAGVLQEGRGSSAVAGDCDTILRLRKASPKGKKPAMLSYSGRATEDTELALKLKPSLFFEPLVEVKSTFQLTLEQVLADPDVKNTVYAQAMRLAELTGEKFERCKSAINRTLEVK